MRYTIVGNTKEVDDALEAWCLDRGETPSEYDICADCEDEWDLVGGGVGLDEITDWDGQALAPEKGEPPGDYNLAGDVEHPSYESWTYSCAVCGKALTEEDN